MAGQPIFPEWKTILGSSSRGDQPARQVVKRSGEVHRYEREKIEAAVAKAFEAVGAVRSPIGGDRAAQEGGRSRRAQASRADVLSAPQLYPRDRGDTGSRRDRPRRDGRGQGGQGLHPLSSQARGDARRRQPHAGHQHDDGRLPLAGGLARQGERQRQLLPRRPHPPQLGHHHRQLLAQETSIPKR